MTPYYSTGRKSFEKNNENVILPAGNLERKHFKPSRIIDGQRFSVLWKDIKAINNIKLCIFKLMSLSSAFIIVGTYSAFDIMNLRHTFFVYRYSLPILNPVMVSLQKFSQD